MIRRICLFLALLPFLLTLSCDQQPASGEKKVKKKPVISPEVLFPEARSQMINGQFSEAANAFEKITEESKVRQPLLTWIDFHQGLALLLAGREDEARLVFAKIEARGPFTTAGSDAPVAAYFVNLAHLMTAKDATPPDVGKDYDKFSYEGIALLALGLKDWSLDKYDEAVALFRQFGAVAPEKMVEWADGPPDLAKLKEIANNFVNDYNEFTPADKGIDAATTPEDQQKAIDEAKAARGRMKLTTKLSKALDAKIADVGPKVAAIMAEKMRASDEEIAADAKALGAAKDKRADLIAKYQFAEARTAMLDPSLKTEKARDEQEFSAKRLQWLASFKSQLVEDLAKKGYKEAIKNKAGESLAGGVAKADEQQVIINSAKGPVAVPWGDISPESAYTMASSFITPDIVPELVTFRKWNLGVFAAYLGKKKEALDLMHEAAKVRPIYNDEIPLFEKDGPFF